MLIALLLALSVAIRVHAGDSLPFKGTATLTTDWSKSGFGLCGGGSGFLFYNEGAGEATHLGQFTIIHPNCSGSCDLDGTHLCSETGTMRLTAANGDQLVLSTAGPYNLDTGFELDQFVIIGGSGRFQDATGNGIVLEQYGPYHVFIFDGTIDFKKK